ncbi:MAG TPA: PhzF family phenazine biosynthesis protein [Acidimicrobiales bacterium]|nr:PhzF family phenazine biosynthesis protein [Acidimicrobiales bacterium]
MVLELVVVDAFTDRPFSGNPAAVAVLDAFPAETRMQAIASEMALSETAFCAPRPDGDHDLRWFSPTMEIDLCGHATLATAHVLGGATRFWTRGGELPCRPGADGLVIMDFPADPPRPAEHPAELASCFGDAEVRAFARTRQDALVELADAAGVRQFRPDLRALASLARRGVIVTAAGDRVGVDCVSRFFAPNAGVPEDPVTGSAHCALAVWWGGRLGRSELVGEQASPRGGTVRMACRGGRVELAGRAVTVSTVTMVV